MHPDDTDMPRKQRRRIRRHRNGGGLVFPGMIVGDSVEIDEGSRVIGKGRITGDVRIIGNSVVFDSELHAPDGQTLVIASSSILKVTFSGHGDVYASLLERIKNDAVGNPTQNSELTAASSKLKRVRLRGTNHVVDSTVSDCLVNDCTISHYTITGQLKKSGKPVIEGCYFSTEVRPVIGYKHNVKAARNRED